MPAKRSITLPDEIDAKARKMASERELSLSGLICSLIVAEEGRKRAGRPKAELPVDEIVAQRQAGKTLQSLADAYGVNVGTIHRLIARQASL
ncbi:hypothetical protein Plim_4301 (plasmid) [Planctopirus limnophila DSM 3776]|uniref:Uncharacterized protein n=1 Tax=Planctopirus limnophila (strain ATCC 43296 / DSM 3776 / IFAM 1008 / Mu 290) TaxID=521674 RepID=D5SZI8_PLAL2|nr:hypothetical protein [Planctopirus limnophila]ADG70108.1 hypothetical protein Plim_4301 [Planctopirus limnophila DSM 3776]